LLDLQRLQRFQTLVTLAQTVEKGQPIVMADVTIVLRPTRHFRKKITKSNALERDLQEQFNVNPISKRKMETTFERKRRKERLPPTKQILVRASQEDKEEDLTEHTVPDGLTWWQRNALNTGKVDCNLYTVEQD
jgi:hypothetical protein